MPKMHILVKASSLASRYKINVKFNYLKKKIDSFNKSIRVSGDKSLSIRWILFSSLAEGISKSENLLLSEDIFAAINAIKKLGIKVKFEKSKCKIYGKGLNGYNFRKNLVINAANSGTLGRLILGLLINTKYPIKLIGDAYQKRF